MSRIVLPLLIAMITCASCNMVNGPEKIDLQKDARIAIIGNNLCSRMMNFGSFETEMHLAYPDNKLFIRNMCDGGDTPGFRPHPGRKSPWAFPGAEDFYQNENANETGSRGDFPTPDEWLSKVSPDILLAFFGYNESFEGEEGLEVYKRELEAFIDHTKQTLYNGVAAPELVLVSPIYFEDLSDKFDYPDGNEINKDLQAYTTAMEDVAAAKEIKFLDLFSASKKWSGYTTDGFQLSSEGADVMGDWIVSTLFSNKRPADAQKDLVHEMVQEKNWMWHNDYKIPNGVHVYGRRYEPFGPENYPSELEKISQMTAIRDSAIWMATNGTSLNIDSLDQFTTTIPEIETNYNPDNIADQAYKYGDDYLKTFTMAPGYKIDIFASEDEFPDLANPVQMSFDNKGRLWVSVMPSYPHYKPGDSKPNDKILILEDTDNDGKADKQTIFAEGLHLPIGFEIAAEGVYVSQGTNLKLLTDTDGDDKADKEEILLSGFDDHDTHHAISAFCTDPSGAIYMGEGVFLHTSVETAYGPERGTNGGFFRYDPRNKKLERTANVPIPNPWGTAFDKFGQNFFIQTSGPRANWMMPSTVKRRYGVSVPLTENLIEKEHMVRPTSGLEFVSSRHFPDEVQGDFLLNNTIGFLGTKQHQIVDDGTGYSTKHRQDLLRSTDGNFRPVDLEFAPDGSLYIVDWHNILVGHMQHNARDPLRDHVHGKVLRVTYPSRPLVKPAEIAGATLDQLFENLKLPESRARYRTKRELRGRDGQAVYDKLQSWKKDQTDELALLEGLWVSWGINMLDQELLAQLLGSDDFRVRSAAVRAIRYNIDKISNYKELLMKAASDEEGRVRLETMVAASWLPVGEGTEIFDVIATQPLDKWMDKSFRFGIAHMNNRNVEKDADKEIASQLKGDELASYKRGLAIYSRDGYCVMCHQEDGKGLAASGFPPLKNSEWVIGDEAILTKLTIKGLYGPITVAGKKYPGQVPMPPYEKMLSDKELADVLTYVRNAFGNKAPAVLEKSVQNYRAEVADKTGYYSAEELIKTSEIQ